MTDAPELNGGGRSASGCGEAESTEEVAAAFLPLVYDELRRLAGRYLADERPGHTLQPTALVHEAYLRLQKQDRVRWRSLGHFRAVGAQAMRRILIDHARRCRARKRGGNLPDITLSDPIQAPGRCDISLVELLTLNQAMEKLAELDSREAQVVELRFFGGSSMDEIAEILGVSKRTVEGDWMHARAWLRCELSRGEDE